MEPQTDKRQQRAAYCLEVYGISQLLEQCDALAFVVVVAAAVGAVDAVSWIRGSGQHQSRRAGRKCN